MREKRDSKAQNRRFVLSSVARSATRSYWVRRAENEVAALRTRDPVRGSVSLLSYTSSANSSRSHQTDRHSGASFSWRVMLAGVRRWSVRRGLTAISGKSKGQTCSLFETFPAVPG